MKRTTYCSTWPPQLHDYFRHLKPLSRLWSSSVLISAGNFLAALMIVSNADVSTYSAYTIGITILGLSTAWTDGGLASTLSILAAQSGDRPIDINKYKTVALHYSIKIGSVAYAAILLLLAGFIYFSNILADTIHFSTMALFAAIGLLQSRASIYAALLHACGDFGSYSLYQALPVLIRLILLSILALVFGHYEMPMLIASVFLTSLASCALALYRLRPRIESVKSPDSDRTVHEVESALKHSLRPSLYASIAGSISYNFTVLGTSLYASGGAIASYGVFARIGQITAAFTTPLNLYTARRLRLTIDRAQRSRKARRFIMAGMLIYALYTAIAFFIYRKMSLYIHHYSLGHPREFLISLVTNALGLLYVMLDSALVSSGEFGHRVTGTLIWCLPSVILVFLLRPTELSTMVSIDALSIAPAVGYYYIRFFRQL